MNTDSHYHYVNISATNTQIIIKFSTSAQMIALIFHIRLVHICGRIGLPKMVRGILLLSYELISETSKKIRGLIAELFKNQSFSMQCFAYLHSYGPPEC